MTREIAIMVTTNLRAGLKRLMAWLRDEPLVDVRLLPNDMKLALKPLIRPTMRYLSVRQARRLTDAACVVIASHERLYAQETGLAKSATSLELANAMAALAHHTTAPGEYDG